MDFLKDVKQIALELAKEQGLELYDVEWLREGNNYILRVSLSLPDSTIDLDLCATFSEAFSVILDEKDLIKPAYYLEVCSPGAERELRTTAEIISSLNEYVYVKLKNPQSGLDCVTGDLTKADENMIQITYRDKTRKKTIDILMTNIALIRLAIKF